MDLSEMMELDAQASQSKIPANEELESVGQLAIRQVLLEKHVESLEQQLKEAQENLARVREVELPEKLEQLGLLTFKLLDGTEIKVVEDIFTGITKENQDAAFCWLKAFGHDGIIKNEVKVAFGKGQDDEAAELCTSLTSQGYSFTNARSVHPQTLKAFVKRQLEGNQPIPTDIFSIHVKKRSKIVEPKKSER